MAIRALGPLLDRDHRNLVYQAVGQHKIAVARNRGVAHDVAAARDRPALEFLRLGIEAHDGIRLRTGFAVPDDIVDRRDAVRLALRSAWRQPLRHLAGRGVETAEITAGIIRVPDDVV